MTNRKKKVIDAKLRGGRLFVSGDRGGIGNVSTKQLSLKDEKANRIHPTKHWKKRKRSISKKKVNKLKNKVAKKHKSSKIADNLDAEKVENSFSW